MHDACQVSSACLEFRSDRYLRRDVLRIGGHGLLGLTLPRLLQAASQPDRPRAKAKSVIFLFQFGGPSHVDTFDMKPEAPAGIRSQYDTIATSVPGLRICEHLPEMARVMHKVTLVRSVFHAFKNHNPASYYALTGHAPPIDDIRLPDTLGLFPAYGSVVDRLAPSNTGTPTFVSCPTPIRDGSLTPGQYASFLGRTHDPLSIAEDADGTKFQLPELSLPADLNPDRLNNRREMQKLLDRQSRFLDFSAEARGLDAYYERALAMFNSPQVGQAFDLSQESGAVRLRYGETTYGRSCLLARRLVEAGVRFVNVYFAPNIGGRTATSGGWDTHGFDNTRMYPILTARHLPLTDHTLPVLLNDLDERGLLDETLVVWMGEFGRTPKINDNISRDHWPQCYTVLLAGGGVKRGSVYGASDANGAFPERDGVQPDDLSATMFSLLGIAPHTQVTDKVNRPVAISAGNPIAGVMG